MSQRYFCFTACVWVGTLIYHVYLICIPCWTCSPHNETSFFFVLVYFTAPQHLVCRVVPSLHINHMQMSIIEVFICRRLHMNTSMILICIWLICRLGTTLHTKCCGAVFVLFFVTSHTHGCTLYKLVSRRPEPRCCCSCSLFQWAKCIYRV